MYNVLLVDDEPILKLALRKVIDWESSSFSLTGNCVNGEEALEFIARNPVDIVVTDLKMPVMDGIELIRELKKRRFPGAILVLSNYSDFQMVREALIAGAMDYILKLEIDSDVFLNHLNRAATSLSQMREEVIELQQKEKQAAQYRHQAIVNVLSESPSPASLKHLENDPLFSSPIRLTDIRIFSPTHKDNLRESVLGHVLDLAQTTFTEVEGAEFVVLSNDEFILLSPHSGTADSSQALETLCLQFERQVLMYFNLTVCFIMPSPCEGPQDVREKFALCARGAMALFYTDLTMIRPEEIKVRKMARRDEEAELAKKVLDAHGTGNLQAPVEAAIQSLLVNPPMEIVPPADIKKLLRSVLFQLSILVGVPQQSDYGIVEAQRLSEALQVFQSIAQSYIDESDMFLSSHQEVQRIEKYIQLHYKENFSLNDVAEEVRLNRSYLCRLFKHHTGMSIFEYLTQLRMKKAARKLGEGKHYVKEVAQQVGYADALYFTRVFKKHYGISPTEYAEKSTQNSQ